MKRFARIAVRPGDNEKDPDKGCLILGLTHGDVFKPGHVYEIVEIMGEHIVRDVGISAASGRQNRSYPVTIWEQDANQLVMSGDHLFTIEEMHWKRMQDVRCKNCAHMGAEHKFVAPGIKCLFGPGVFEEDLSDQG